MRTSRRLPFPRISPRLPALALGGILAACTGNLQQTRAVPPLASDEPAVTAELIGPLTKQTPLQIVSVFPSEPGEALLSPATELAALIADQRTAGHFGSVPLRTLLLEPPPPPIKAKRLLYIGLGPRADFSLDLMREVGATAMHEALRLGVERMAFAPIVRDQGMTLFTAEEVAAAFIEGALVQWGSQQRANPQQPGRLMEVTYEAGPAFIQAVTAAVPRAVKAAHDRRSEPSRALELLEQQHAQ